MARSKTDDNLISYKVSKLQREGFPLRQARAIALRMYRDGEIMGAGSYGRPKKRKAPSKPSRTRRTPSRTRRR